jgi:hypothetical protein
MISAAVVAATAIATAGVAGTGGAGSAVADANAPAGVIVLSGPAGVITAVPTTPPPAPGDAPAGQPSAGPDTPATQPAPGDKPATQPAPGDKPAQPAPPAATPELRITLAYERHDRDLTITLTFSGYVFRPFSTKTGQVEEYPIPAKRDIGTYEHLDWGDATSYTAPNKAQRCPQGTEKRYVHQVADRYQLRKTYRRGGDYTLNYEYDACGLTNGKIAGQLRMHVP